ncbi:MULTISPECIES: UDP-N-acetylglucosamine 1-carboxyvinyltransferase [Thermoactinomyces]|jgi:UDP-N-acetylglucosamine 1-carboxyvinyltransferase|uniref:UDP-N-acetylglucosamine 1-carboxyvinyltransferase n=1 Tax=Thermoactinomyces daqus TaxID=1329516 RepID=A0A7W1X857_9BACL|nr:MULTISPECIES: UDP-N-acetylglucosamine 1-carboxyvinyltransferase [Thermoactinomyces]MBA4541820.1 UDP-N-acetylglucosamine 1-carboxyvinyltransferase [Thermoactinomyces daqus]MBH8597817.1 UDP-N-acetylglucosamine 1-carboxyvinyltransferase [Thermoactinomyces sp. CICC 10523]MBH8604168.1 UDP-N-acetylglucosamine 1-carboxyvinyltransferase [Thermoactinomyces sp. CICC 10522]MBH8608110.1 UDP-N-acetylglucosamine 1-carboxyvinyltransferase [Thermoactinomyces sp. CICC 10521]
MEKIIVQGGTRLRGRVKVHGAKNAVLPLIAASILASRGEISILDVPMLEDVKTITQMLKRLGVAVTLNEDNVVINAEKMISTEAPYDLVRKMRASVLVMGPLLARKKRARVPLPGGCAIGSRPIDLHIKGFEAMGVQFETGQGFIEGYVPDRLKGATIYLDFPSVGATQNIMMAATLAEGRTIIENAACEPEIVDLANFLNAMGAKVRGAGTDEIRIDGVDFLRGTEYTVIPDRIEAGTYMVAAAITRGEVFVEGAISDHLVPLIAKLREMGVHVLDGENGIHVRADGDLKPADVKTLPYPGFPTDMQSQMMALLLTAKGTSLLTETVFENRFMHVEEFKRMGAQIKIDGRTAIIDGGKPLSGAQVKATDLRAGAALILAGLAAEGITELTELHHVDRGYVDIVGKLRGLGAKIARVPVEEASHLKQKSFA